MGLPAADELDAKAQLAHRIGARIRVRHLSPSDAVDVLDATQPNVSKPLERALLAEILRLPPEERIDLLSDAWDAIAESPSEMPVPEWQVRELERRLADPEPQYVSWKEVRERLQMS